MILANWRGFSGGQRDMYNEVLKYGSFIVDALVKFEQPVFIYIPPFGELRGGSWVVVDPTINATAMEMYADVEARGGVLEPEGIIGIKYRKDKQIAAMARLDEKYAALKKQLAKEGLSKEETDAIKKQMAEREQQLLPVYAQISLQYADLHDRAGRMKAKGVIRDILEWREARRFFYWRVRRRLNEEYILRRITTAAATTKTGPAAAARVPMTPEARARHLQLLEAWCGCENFATNDRAVSTWYEENRKMVHDKVDALKREAVAGEMRELFVRAAAVNVAPGKAVSATGEAVADVKGKDKGLGAAWSGVRDMLRVMPVEERERVMEFLKQV